MKTNIGNFLDRVRYILNGNPLRAIGYGAAAIVYFAARALNIAPELDAEGALLAAGAAIGIVASVIETARRYVYSPNSVDVIVSDIITQFIEADVVVFDPDEEPA